MHRQTKRKPPLISQIHKKSGDTRWHCQCSQKHFNNHGVHSVAAPLREGKNQNEKTFGIPAEEIFQAIYRSPLTLLSPVRLHCRHCVLLLKPSLPLAVLQVRGGDAEVHGSDELLLGSRRPRHRHGVQPLQLSQRCRSRRSEVKLHYFGGNRIE